MTRLSPEVLARVLPILREAIDVTEQLDGEMRRPGERAHVGTYLRLLGLADQFDNYGATEIQNSYDAEEPEWRAKLKALTQIEAETKRRLRVGDIVGAQEAYVPAANDLHNELFKDSGSGDFVDWLIEIGDFDSALKVVDSWVGQTTYWNAMWYAREKARILLRAGRRAEAMDFLAERGAEAEAAGDSEMLFVIAHSLVMAKELTQARAIFRSAATSALAAASREVRRLLAGQHDDGASFIQDATPVSIAQFQCEIGDKEGAVTTLKSVLTLEPPPVTKEERQRRRGPTIWTFQLTTATPMPLLPTAPMVPATWVPWPLSSKGLLSLLAKSQPTRSST